MNRATQEILDTCFKYYNGRTILIWGKNGALAKVLETELIKCRINVLGRIDSNPAFVDETVVFKPEILKGGKENYYVIVPVGRYPEIRNCLQKYGFDANVDYYYFADCSVKENPHYYEDKHGNTIIGYHENFSTVLMGYESEIKIGTGSIVKGKITTGSNCKVNIGNNSSISVNMKVGDNASIQIGDNCNVEIRDVVLIGEESTVLIDDHSQLLSMDMFRCSVNSKVKIGQRTIFVGGGFISVQQDANLEIGEESNFGWNNKLLAVKDTTIMIGKGALASWDVSIVSGDAHSVFDVNTKDNINKDKKNVSIDEHVWMGAGVVILPQSRIGIGSVVGASSLVKGSFPNNCMLAGTPAKIIRKDIAWSNQFGAEIDDCDIRYLKHTL